MPEWAGAPIVTDELQLACRGNMDHGLFQSIHAATGMMQSGGRRFPADESLPTADAAVSQWLGISRGSNDQFIAAKRIVGAIQT